MGDSKKRISCGIDVTCCPNIKDELDTACNNGYVLLLNFFGNNCYSILSSFDVFRN